MKKEGKGIELKKKRDDGKKRKEKKKNENEKFIETNK